MQWFSVKVSFAPQEAVSNVWKHFLIIRMGEGRCHRGQGYSCMHSTQHPNAQDNLPHNEKRQRRRKRKEDGEIIFY